MQDFQISSYFIEFHENDYKLWKNYRKKLIKVLSLKLSVISDDILMQINEEWEEALNSPLPNELSQTASQSCLLNKFLFTTIHFYFFRSFERINSTFHLILSYIDKNNFLLTRSGMKCLYWLSIDSKEGEMIFAEPLKILIGLIKDKCKPSLYFNAIMIIKYTRKILKNEINNIFFTESNILLKIGFNSDGILQDEVLKIYRSQEDEPGFYLSTRIYDLAYSKCMSIRLTTLSRIRFAAYIINRIILSSNFQQFADLSRFSNALIQLKESQKEEEYKKTLNEVTKMIILVTNESSKDFIQIIFNLQLETPTESFLYFIDKFQEHIDFNKLLSLVYANKITCSESLCTFLILEKIIVYSMEYSDNNDLFVDSKRINTTKVCKHFTKCLKLQNSLFTDSIHQKCLDVINNPLLKNEEECLIWIPFFAANVEFFSNRKAIAKSLNDIFFELSDTLRSVIIDTLDFINDPNTRNNFILRIMTTEHKKSLRFQAIQKLILNARISSNPLFYSFINDSCFKVRRFMLFLLESNFKLNPFQTYPVVRTFTLSYFNDILSEVDGRYAMKLASMMPFLAHHCSICQNCRRQYAKTVISTSLTILVERNIHKRDEKDVVNSHHATSEYSVASSMNYSTGSFRTSPDESHSESSITNVEIPEFDEDLLSRPVKNSHQSYTKGNEMSLSKQIKSNYESFYLNRRDVDLLRAVVYLAKYCEPHLQSILNVFYSILTSRSDDYLLEEAIKCLTNFSSQMFNGLNIRLQCPQLISPLLRILSVTSSENLAISILKLFGSSFDSITIQSPSFFNEQPDFNDLAYYTDFILSSILAFSANSNRRTLKAITIIFENDPINSSKYLVKVIPIILSAFDKAHPQQITSLFTYLTCIAAHCPVDSIQLFPQLLTFIQSYLHYEECIKMCIIFGKKFTSDFLTIVSDIYPKIIQHCFLHTLKYFQYSIRFLVLAISRYNQHIDLFLLMLEKIDNVSVWDTSLIVDSLTYLAQQTDVSLYITRFLILASGFNSDISNLMYSLIIYHKFDIHQISFFDINTTELFNEANSLLNDSSKELNSDWNQRLHIIIESKIKIIDLDISMPTISNKYSTLQSYFLEFTYPNETELKKFMNSLILYVINNSPYAGIRGCIEFINYRQHLIKKLFPIAFLSLWKITTKNDRQYFSSIINKIIHEHTSIDGLLMTLIQFLDRNDEPFDIDYITVAKVCKNPHYAYLVLYKRYQRGDKSILPLLFKSALKLNKLDVIKSFFSEAEPLLKKEDIAEYCGYLGNWKKALNIYKEIKAPLSKIINCLYMMKNYPAIYDLSHKFNQIQDQNEREDATIPMLWAYCVFRENTKIENLLKISNNIENNEQFYTFLIIFNISIKKFDQAKFYLDKSLKLIASKRKIFNKGDQFQLQELMNNLQLLYECQEVLEYKSLQMSQETPNWNHRIKYFKRDETTWERMIFLRNMVVPMVSNTSAYLDIIGCVRKAGYMKLIKQLFDICFDYTMSSTVPIERIKIQWACNNHEIAYNMVRVCLFFNLTANIYDFIYTVIQEDMPFPFMAFFLDSQMPSFGTEMKEYCVDYFDETLFSNTISVVRELPYKEQKEFFRHLLTKFPYQLYVSHISVNTNEAIMLLQSFANLNYTYEVSYLFAKYSAILNFNSLSAMKIATKYYRTAIEIKPLSAQAWSGWSFTNFRIFIMLKESDQLNNSNVGSLNEYYNKNENSNKADLSENEELKDIVEVLESDKARKISEEVLANVEYKDLYKPLSEANHQYEKNVMEFRQKISQFYPQSNDPNYYGANAIQGLLHAINLTTENSLEYLCQLCFILFTMTNSKLITDDTIESIINIPTAKLFLVAPQITSHMHHKDPRIKAIVYNLLNNIGSEYFQEIFFALNLYSLDGSQIAQEILYFLKNNNSQTLYEEVEMFADGMIRSACTWLEEWKKSLEIIILDPELIDSILPPLFEKLYHPKCELDSFFIRIYGKIIIDQIKELYEKHSQSSISQMMIKIKQIHASIKDIVGKLSVLVLHKVSENLASKRHFEMKVPGSHNETIDYIEPVMDVLGTQQHPRCVTIVSNHGERIKFLLKGSEDLRIDERFMQFFSLVNIIIKHSRSLEGLIVAHYPVIPLAINSGLIKFYTISVTFHQMILEARKIYNIPYSIESIIEDDYCGNLSLKLNSLQKFELFNLVADKCKAYELADITSRYSPSSVAHLAKRAMFTRTTAIMSIIGYIIGLGDRHPSNIMIQKSSGSIIHIDFGDAFESTILRSSFPEKVPFRMTRMFMNAIEGNVTDGLFEKTCIELMKLLRKKRSTLSSQLTIFLQEPLEFSREETDEKRKYIIDRINLKLNGKEFGDGKSESTVEDQVRILINEAINPQNYCQHYPGWCPYW